MDRAYHFLVESLVIFDDLLEVEMESHKLLCFFRDFELNGDESVRTFGVNHRLMLIHELQSVVEEQRTHERQRLKFL